MTLIYSAYFTQFRLTWLKLSYVLVKFVYFKVLFSPCTFVPRRLVFILWSCFLFLFFNLYVLFSVYVLTI